MITKSRSRDELITRGQCTIYKTGLYSYKLIEFGPIQCLMHMMILHEILDKKIVKYSFALLHIYIVISPLSLPPAAIIIGTHDFK